MTARIAGFVTRAQAGLRRPRSINRNVNPERGGLAVHYGGAGAPPSTHAGCAARWRAWQDYHMDGRGWSDIAYSFGYCQHGYVFAGRGYGVRTAANGTNDGNQRFLAACWIGGGTTAPTRAALDALEWIVAEVRRLGAGREVRPHRYFKDTLCPGAKLTEFAGELHSRVTTPTPPPAPTPTPPPAPAPTPEDDVEVHRADLKRTKLKANAYTRVPEVDRPYIFTGHGTMNGLVHLAVSGIPQAGKDIKVRAVEIDRKTGKSHVDQRTIDLPSTQGGDYLACHIVLVANWPSSGFVLEVNPGNNDGVEVTSGKVSAWYFGFAK